MAFAVGDGVVERHWADLEREPAFAISLDPVHQVVQQLSFDHRMVVLGRAGPDIGRQVYHAGAYSVLEEYELPAAGLAGDGLLECYRARSLHGRDRVRVECPDWAGPHRFSRC
jgi:hypothetical protein